MGTPLKVLDKSYPMNTNMIGIEWYSKNLCILLLWTKVASALGGLNQVAVILVCSSATVSYLSTFPLCYLLVHKILL